MPPSPPIFSAQTTTPPDAPTAATAIASEMLEVNRQMKQRMQYLKSAQIQSKIGKYS
ncbi:hypothetical protein NG799_29225 [Laspinema sp. D1]|uniref:Uncharacterized protein n=1 Tax=Laspinema palackyanum D2a TaxID=2953684 RepID=A0ABT2N070_9CYAN|nr:hypothetical protein [Laspinema sp. D2a]